MVVLLFLQLLCVDTYYLEATPCMAQQHWLYRKSLILDPLKTQSGIVCCRVLISSGSMIYTIPNVIFEAHTIGFDFAEIRENGSLALKKGFHGDNWRYWTGNPGDL